MNVSFKGVTRFAMPDRGASIAFNDAIEKTITETGNIDKVEILGGMSPSRPATVITNLGSLDEMNFYEKVAENMENAGHKELAQNTVQALKNYIFTETPIITPTKNDACGFSSVGK